MLHYGVGIFVSMVVVGLSWLFINILLILSLAFSSCALHGDYHVYYTHALSEKTLCLFYKEIYIYIYLREEFYQRKGDELEKHKMENRDEIINSVLL